MCDVLREIFLRFSPLKKSKEKRGIFPKRLQLVDGWLKARLVSGPTNFKESTKSLNFKKEEAKKKFNPIYITTAPTKQHQRREMKVM